MDSLDDKQGDPSPSAQSAQARAVARGAGSSPGPSATRPASKPAAAAFKAWQGGGQQGIKRPRSSSTSDRMCSVPECPNKVNKNDLCHAHVNFFRRKVDNPSKYQYGLSKFVEFAKEQDRPPVHEHAREVRSMDWYGKFSAAYKAWVDVHTVQVEMSDDDE